MVSIMLKQEIYSNNIFHKFWGNRYIKNVVDNDPVKNNVAFIIICQLNKLWKML